MYDVRFYKGNYKRRQQQANWDNCTAYVEHHFNATANPERNYAVVITGYLASEMSKSWGRWYANKVGEIFQIPVAGTGGVLVGGYNGRGNGNLKYTRMPAILLEPLFVSNPLQAEIVRSEDGQDKLAKILADSIVEFFPNGGRIAFSIGHKYKTSRPRDRGAVVFGGGTEADFAEIVMEKAKYLLENHDPATWTPLISEEEDVPENDIRVIKNGEELWVHTDTDEDDEILWDDENRILYINTQ
ncbi:N-acetylmuramoyl-L-alanine amidase [Candidatus Parabeggiatoa sp. HSG14]|uniref:N-acetylmuramoyl-L-alanine amidase n=1 Tax=Candidatus Parabeggiatoa sp. HSG14 TaxID=3055593 RepID=UPI0025A76900|nr:N-acetylmuramoyl-L-alanine amidase [Thiotrichales bacterium HSG14]